MTQLSRASEKRRDWTENETERLREVFERVWDEVGSQVAYEVILSEITPREVVFTVGQRQRLFVRPEVVTEHRRTIQGVSRAEQNGFGIYVEYRASGGRTRPPHLDEYLQETIIGVGAVAKEIAVLPVKISAEMTVETWQYSKMPPFDPSQDVPSQDAPGSV